MSEYVAESRPVEREGYRVCDCESAVNAVRPLMDTSREVFVALDLDGRHNLIAARVVSIGSMTASIVHPREVFRDAIQNGACALVVAHNHPSGNPEPSRDDIEITRRLVRAGALIGIPILDHVIVRRMALGRVSTGKAIEKERSMLIPKAIAALAKAATNKDDVCPYTDAVRLERTDAGPRAVLTDGHVLLAARWAEHDHDEYPDMSARGGTNAKAVPGWSGTILCGELKAAANAVPKRTTLPALQDIAVDETQNGNGVTWGATDLDSVSSGTSRGVEDYPDVAAVCKNVKAREHPTTVYVNPYKLAAMLLAMAEASGAKKNDKISIGISIPAPDPETRFLLPVRLELRYETTSVAGLLMPQRMPEGTTPGEIASVVLP